MNEEIDGGGEGRGRESTVSLFEVVDGDGRKIPGFPARVVWWSGVKSGVV